MRQRILSTLLVFCLLLGEFSISASAAEIASGTCGESSGVSWILDDSGTLTICGNGAMPDYGWSVAGGGNAPWIDYTDNIKSVVVESGVTKVGGCAFWGCDNLKTVTLSETVTDITGGAFFEMCDSLEEIVVDKNNPLYIAINGVLFTSDLQTLVVYPSGKKEISYTVPEITKVIGDNAFIQSQLETVILPEGLAKIEDSAFYSCSVSNITIPDSVTEIGAGAFAYCYNLTNIEIPEKVTQIDEQTFSFCDNLTTVVLPSTIETIADWAFAYDTKLSDVYYGGSLSDWSKIDIGESNEYLTSATIHCKDGVISTDKIVGFYPGNNAQIEKLEQSMIRIEFDREVLSGQVRNNYADLDFSKTPLAIYRASDDQLLYQVKENNGEGISFDVTSYPSSPTEVNISITNGESLFVPGESYYVTMGAGFIRLTDGTTSPEINKNDWTFKIKSIDKLIGYSFLNRSDPNLLEAGFSSNTKYMITGDYLNALKNNLGPIEETLACIMRQNKWEGHCYGMAAVFALQKTNNIDLAFFQKDVEELFELDFPKNNWTVFNLLTYYHLLQRNDLDRFNYSLQGQADNAENVIEIMKQEEKFVIIEITLLLGIF